MKRTLTALQAAARAFAEEAFPNQAVSGKINHLQREVIELMDAHLGFVQAGQYHLGNSRDDCRLSEVVMELADCQLLLIQIASFVGVSAEALIESCYTKLEINRQRVWGPPNAD